MELAFNQKRDGNPLQGSHCWTSQQWHPAPWEGDMPVGHTETNDRAKAIQSDQFVRNKAISKGVPINLVDDYGYQWLGPPSN